MDGDGSNAWARVPVWDGDKRGWKAYKRDVELYLETEKLDVDNSHGARLVKRLTGAARRYTDNIPLDSLRRKEEGDKPTRDGMVQGVKALMRSLEDAMGIEDASKKGQVQ